MKPMQLWALVFTAIVLTVSFLAIGGAIADDEKQGKEKQKGQLVFDCPDAPEPIVEINLSEKLIALVTKSVSANPEAAELIEMLSGIYVRAYEGEDTDADTLIGYYEKKLKAEEWELLAKFNNDKEKIQIRLLYDEEVVSGIFVAVMAQKPEQVTLVNIVGNIDVQRIGELFANLGDVVNIDIIDIESWEGKERKASPEEKPPDEAD